MKPNNPWDALAGCVLAANNLRRTLQTMNTKDQDLRDTYDHALSSACDAIGAIRCMPLPDAGSRRADILRASMHGYIASADLLLSQARATFQAEIRDPVAEAKMAIRLFEASLPKQEDAGDYYDQAYAKRVEAMRLLDREFDPDARKYLQQYVAQVSYVGD